MSTLAIHASLLSVAIIFGGLTVIGRVTLASFPPAVLAAARVLGAAALLHGAALLAGKGRWPKRRGEGGNLVLLSILGVVLNQYSFVKGLSMTTAFSAAVIITTIPIFTSVFSAALGVETLSPRRAGGILLAFAGVLMLIDPFHRGAELGRGSPVGDLWIVFNCACYSMFLVLSHPVRKRMDSLSFTGWIFTIGVVFLVPFGAAEAARLDFSRTPASGWAGLAYCVVFATMLGYWLNLRALPHAGPTLISLYTYLQPVVAALLGPLIGERLTLHQGLSSLLVFAGVYVAATRAPNRPVPAPEPVLAR